VADGLVVVVVVVVVVMATTATARVDVAVAVALNWIEQAFNLFCPSNPSAAPPES
jgi:hypothetical protein